MTPTLEAFHQSRIHPKSSRAITAAVLFPRSHPPPDHDESPSSLGANKVFLGALPEEAQELILLEQSLLGTILRDCGIKHKTEAKHFLRIQPDALIQKRWRSRRPSSLRSQSRDLRSAWPSTF